MSNSAKLNSEKPNKFAGLIQAAGLDSNRKQKPVHPSSSPAEPLIHASFRPSPQPSPSFKTSTVGRRSNPAYVQISAYINRRLYRSVQKALLDQDHREVSQLLEQLLIEWMDAGCPDANHAQP